MNFCIKCGHKFEAGEKSCPICGNQKNTVSQETAELISDENEVYKDITHTDENSHKTSFIKKIKRKRLRLPIIIGTVLICLIFVSLGLVKYTHAVQVKKGIELGNKYLQEGKYQEAILEFKKVIEIEPKNVNARIGLAKAYIMLNKLEDAEKVLLEAREIDKMNAEVLLLLNELWKDTKPEDLYQAFAEYLKVAVAPNINQQVKKIYDDMSAKPTAPKADIPSGKYAQEIQVTVTIENISPGYLCYYTLDGSEPGKNNGTIYTKPISIGQGHTVLKAVVINVINIASETFTVEYDVDAGYKDKIIALIKEAQKEYDNAQEGTEPGKYLEGSKAALLSVIQSSQAVVENKIASHADIDARFSELTNALSDFGKKKIPQTNKTNLRNEIDKSKKLVESSTEGQKDGQVKPGSKAALNKAVTEAQKVLDDIFAIQQTIDNAVKNLKNAEVNFENNRVKLIVNPDGSNFTYGYKTLMGDSTNKTFKGTFKVIKSGTAILNNATKQVYEGETGTIEIRLVRQNNSVTVYAIETWDKDHSYIYTLGQWYAEYNGATDAFKLYPSGGSSTDKFEGTFVNGVMTGKMYISGIGYFLDFTAK